MKNKDIIMMMMNKKLYLRRKGYVKSAMIDRFHVTIAYKGEPHT